jgi:hypothetical protein
MAVKPHRFGSVVRALTGTLLTLAFMQLLPPPAAGGVKVVETEDFSLELGLRLQPRVEVDQLPATAGGTDWMHDFFIRRARVKANGTMKRAIYNFELKIDRTDQRSVNPSAAVENAWMQYPLFRGLELRAGLYDLPFSRDLLISDSKHLAVDRGAVSNVPSALGLADNATGFDLRGKVKGGRAEYAVGLFDNRVIPGGFQGDPMVAGRLDFNFASTKDVFKDTHFGADSWLSLGLDGSYQGSIENEAGENHGSNATGGVDGMIDVPVGSLRVFSRAEANVIKVVRPGGGNPVDTLVWMLGTGLTLMQRFQPFVRFDEIRSDDGGVKDIIYVGTNFYQKEHSLKIQGDIRFESGTGESMDGGRLQAQMDF